MGYSFLRSLDKILRVKLCLGERPEVFLEEEPMPTLKALREEALLRQAVLADRCGVTVQTIYYWEGGVTVPRLSHMRKLVEALHKTPAEIREAIQATAREKKDWAAA